MATIPTQTHPLLTVPFSASMDFTVLADYCEHFAQMLTEDDDPTLKMALCGRLNACLTLLQPGLLDPIPEHLIASLIVDVPPDDYPRFEPECTQLCGYCLALTETLAGQGLAAETEKQLGWLLYELTRLFTVEMKSPRWLRTAEGVTLI